MDTQIELCGSLENFKKLYEALGNDVNSYDNNLEDLTEHTVWSFYYLLKKLVEYPMDTHTGFFNYTLGQDFTEYRLEESEVFGSSFRGSFTIRTSLTSTDETELVYILETAAKISKEFEGNCSYNCSGGYGTYKLKNGKISEKHK